MKKLLLALLLCSPFLILGQVKKAPGTFHKNTDEHANLDDLPLQHQVTDAITDAIFSGSELLHTSYKPYFRKTLRIDSLAPYFTGDRRYFNKADYHFLAGHLIEIDQPDFKLFIDPVFDLEIGKDLADSTGYSDTIRLYNNTRGFNLAGQIGKKVSFQSSLFENQGFYPLYYKIRADSMLVIPGQGRWKPFENGGFDFSASTGKVDIALTENINFSVGHGKFFIGNGYRSLMMSDGAFSAPYSQLHSTSKNGKLMMSRTLMGLTSLERLPLGEVPESLFKKKTFTTHYVSYIPFKGLELGFFEGIVWDRFDQNNGSQALPWNAIVSIPLSNTLVYGFKDSSQHVVIGANISAHLNEKLQFYGQIVTDNPSSNQFGYQAGFRSAEFIRGLSFRAEYNIVKSETYSHINPLQAYTHNNDFIAHPLGNNFQEVILVLDHRINRWWSRWKMNYQKIGSPTSMLSVEDASLIANPQIERYVLEAQLGYTMNPRMRWQWILGMRYFDSNSGSLSGKTTWVYFGMRTAIVNKYYDF